MSSASNGVQNSSFASFGVVVTVAEIGRLFAGLIEGFAAGPALQGVREGSSDVVDVGFFQINKVWQAQGVETEVIGDGEAFAAASGERRVDVAAVAPPFSGLDAFARQVKTDALSGIRFEENIGVAAGPAFAVARLQGNIGHAFERLTVPGGDSQMAQPRGGPVS